MVGDGVGESGVIGEIGELCVPDWLMGIILCRLPWEPN